MSTFILYPGYFNTNTGFITTSSGDDYTSANPSASGTGAYVDGETVHTTFDHANTTRTPRVQLGSRGLKPIFTPAMRQMELPLKGTITNGDVIKFTATGGSTPGGTHDFFYEVNNATASFNGTISGST